MAKKKTPNKKDAEWAEAKRRCRLSEEDVCMAKQLGLSPRSLIKNIPNASQSWKMPVKDWVQEMFNEKMGMKAKRLRQELERLSRTTEELLQEPQIRIYEETPTPPEETVEETLDVEAESEDSSEEWETDFDDPFAEPTEKDIRETNRSLKRRQGEFRRAAELVTQELSKVSCVQKVVLFGSVARPLQKEIPRFREYRRHRIAVWHECKDVDLAVWVTDLDNLKSLQRARSRALNMLLETDGIGVAHHQVDMFLMEPGSDSLVGWLCSFGQCPKRGNRHCIAGVCGRKLFLKQYQDFVFRPDSLAPEKSVVLFARNGDKAPEDDDSKISF